MSTTFNCTTEKLADIPDINGSANATGMVMVGGITYCVKSNAGTAHLYKYDDCEVSEYTTETINDCNSFGLTFSPNTKNIYTAAQGKKVFTKGIDGTLARAITVNESEVKGITYYEDNKFILMASDLCSDQYLCFIVGNFSGGLFYLKDTFYVYNNGYNTVKDIYYNGTNGLFIVTNDSDNLKNKILRTSMKTMYGNGVYNGKAVYAVDEILQVDFSSAIYTQCTVESMALDKYGKVIMLCNAVSNGNAADGFFRITNHDYEKKHYTEFRCSVTPGITVPNYRPNGFSEKVTNLSGMVLNGQQALFVKNSSAINKSALYVFEDYTNTTGSAYALAGDGISYGMLYRAGYVFVAYGSQIRQFYARNVGENKIGDLRRTYPLSGYTIQGLTLFEDDLFIALDTKSSTEPTRLHFRILDCSVGTTARQVGDFYVDCGEDCRLQDIYYNANHGLFIATNDLDYSTCKNCILRVDLTYLNKRRVAGDAINGEELPVASRWNVNLSTTIYTQCNIESLFISNSGELLVCCNVGKQEGQTAGLTTDGVLKIANFSFRTDGRGILVNVAELNAIPNYGEADVPGTLAVNGRKAYSYITDTGSEQETYLVHTDDYRNGTFTVETTKLTDKGHCNGGAYYKNVLYSCDYDRSASKMDIGIFELSNDYSEISYKTQEVNTGNNLYGAIAYYNNGEFLLVDYVDSENSDKNYAEEIHIDTGKFNKDNSGVYSYTCTASDYLTIENPMYNANVTSGPLQDAHYEPGVGMFLGGYVIENGKHISYVMRIDIDSYIKNGITENLSPTEIYLLRYQNVQFETESPSISEYGELLMATNRQEDILVGTTNLIFVHEQ